MIDILDLLHRCSPALAVLWLVAYAHRRVTRLERAHRLECERLVDEIRRIDPRTAECLEVSLAPPPPPPPAPVEPPAELPSARVVRGSW